MDHSLLRHFLLEDIPIVQHCHISDIFGCDVFFLIGPNYVDDLDIELLLHEIDDDVMEWMISHSYTLDILELRFK